MERNRSCGGGPQFGFCFVCFRSLTPTSQAASSLLLPSTSHTPPAMPPSRTSHAADQVPDDDELSRPFHHRLRTRNERDRSATIKREPPPDKHLQRRPARLMEVVITRSSTPLLGYIKREHEVVRQSSLAAGALAAARSVANQFVDEVLQSMVMSSYFDSALQPPNKYILVTRKMRDEHRTPESNPNPQSRKRYVPGARPLSFWGSEPHVSVIQDDLRPSPHPELEVKVEEDIKVSFNIYEANDFI